MSLCVPIDGANPIFFRGAIASDGCPGHSAARPSALGRAAGRSSVASGGPSAPLRPSCRWCRPRRRGERRLAAGSFSSAGRRTSTIFNSVGKWLHDEVLVVLSILVARVPPWALQVLELSLEVFAEHLRETGSSLSARDRGFPRRCRRRRFRASCCWCDLVDHALVGMARLE